MQVARVQRDEVTGVITIDYAPEERHRCPCCGYPTLHSRRDYDICELCRWEDDGQGDASADEAWGGPNAHYSLTQARRNFLAHLTKYDETHPYYYDDTDAMREGKRRVMAAFEAVMLTSDPAKLIEAWRNVIGKEETLKEIKRRRLEDEEYEKERHKRFLDHWERREPGFKVRYAILEAEVAQRRAEWTEDSSPKDA